MDGMKQRSMDSLLQILKDSLIQKLEIMVAVEKKSREQAELLTNPEVAVELLDRNMDEKAQLIEKIAKLDSGFEALYENIREELIRNKDAYKDRLREIQQCISRIMDVSVSIQAIEARNKVAVEMYFKNRKKSMQHRKNASSVASHYQKTYKNLNGISPQFIDNKK